MTLESAYSILGLPLNAGASQVKTAYKRLANQYHPDKENGSHEKFIDVQLAYQLIIDALQSSNVVKVTLSLFDAYTGGRFKHAGQTVSYQAGIRPGTKIVRGIYTYVIDVASHPVFKRANDDLLITIDVSCFDIIDNKSIPIRLISGEEIEFRLTDDINISKTVVIPGKGMPNPMFDKIGDLLVKINILIPFLTPAQKSCIIKAVNTQH